MPGAGFLLNNEMGDFNAGPGLTDERRADRHRAEPGRARQAHAVEHDADDRRQGRHSCSWSPARPGGRTIINTVLLTILNVVDFGMNAQEAVDAGRFHHQWLPDRISLGALRLLGRHASSAAGRWATRIIEGGDQGAAQVIVFNQKDNMLEGGVDRRPADGGAAGK